MMSETETPQTRQTARGSEAMAFAPRGKAPPVEWIVTDGLVPYQEAVAAMEDHVTRIAADGAAERVWLLEHPPLYTAGTSARAADLVTARFPVHQTGRGGQYTYHGPGQRVVYLMLDLQRRRPDVRAFVGAIEDWTIATLARLNITAERRQDRVGVWVRRADKSAGFDGTPAEDKIAAIGIRLRRWVSYHGMALNVDPDLGHFDGIVPCGIAARHFGVTSLVDLGHPTMLPEVDVVLRHEFERLFGPTVSASSGLMPSGTADRKLEEQGGSPADRSLRLREHSAFVPVAGKTVETTP